MLKARYSEFLLEAGTDEAGRGCLAGPVVASAVILPKGFEHPFLNDSKQLKETQRLELKEIIEKEAIAWHVAYVYQEEIDKINILNASILAMHRSLEGLETVPEFIAVDGNRFKRYSIIPHKTIVKGDGKYLNIAAASILAKTYRDAYMTELHESFPAYNWQKNKGYPTKEHRSAIEINGISPHHRKSFKLFEPQLKLNL
ncbi:ribonuclease HII [Namhaeicola litoreus]|uniref:Ribonuclease HII n=1 Tax=Namhaeicola litoreus TaxID=1052145 RepID=A0ABW3Y4L7_9FLAO